MVKKTKIIRYSLYVSLLAFITFVGYILYINQEVLYCAHNHSEFLFGSTFFDELMQKPFGLMQYIGAWMSQYLYNPALGACLFCTLWALIYIAGKHAFRLQDASASLMLLPVACLLTSVVDLGYWIYLSRIPGYWFSQSVAYLIILILLWAARNTPRKLHLIWYIVAVCLYPVLGWFSLLFVLCLVFTEKPTWPEFAALILLVFTAPIWHTLLYSGVKSEEMRLAGLPRFIIPTDETYVLTIPFWLLGVISVVIPICSRYLNRWYIPVLSVTACIVFTLSFMYQDDNYIDEIRMTRYAEDGNWNEILTIAKQAKHPTNSMLMLRHVALMNEGGLLEHSFQMGCIPTPINNPDSLHVSFLEIAAPLVYYNYGMLNEGFRLSFECAVQCGFSPLYLRMLARCAHANGEDQLANRYIVQLKHHPGYSNWKPEDPSAQIVELHRVNPDRITGIENSDSYLVNNISHWYETDSKLAAEQALFYSMIRCDSRRFWASFRKFIKTHMDDAFPDMLQEAYIFYMDNAPEEKRVMVPVNQEIYNRYKKFKSDVELYMRNVNLRSQMPEKLYPEYCDTYWYYNLFNRKVY